MRRIGRSATAAGAVLFALAMPAAPALAKLPPDALLAGGGQGGVCYGPPPQMDAGWVGAADNCFSPSQIDVETGGVVRWRLMGQIPHTVTFDEGVDAGTLTADGFAVQLNEPGTYHYRCTLHPGMSGAVEVSGAAIGGPVVEVVDPPASEPVAQVPASAVENAFPTRIELSGLTAAVVLLVGLPLSLAATLRLLGIVGPPRWRLRRAWERPEVAEPASR